MTTTIKTKPSTKRADHRHPPAALPTPRRLKDEQSPAAVRLWVSTPWPKIGGPQLELGPDKRFLEPAFIRRYVPGERAIVYVAGCRGLLASVARLLNIGAWKISTSQIESLGLMPRLWALNADRYGSRYGVGSAFPEDRQFDSWVLSTLGPDVILSPGSPLRLLPRGIEVILPADLSFRMFDQSLRQAMSEAELWRWISSPQGRAHCARLKLSPSRFRRYTAYDMGGADRMSPAREIFLFKPFKESQRLVRVIEEIILGHVLVGP